MTGELSHFDVQGRRISYRLRAGTKPTLMFLPGYASNMDGTKALALDAFAERNGLGMLRFDYSGTGSSGESFDQGTLARWLEEALACLDQLISGRLILIGSSMGGWIALHLARLRRERVQALIGIAAAPDFTNWGFTAEQKAEIQSGGHFREPSPDGSRPPLITRDFYSSGQQLLLLDSEIEIDCPVRLLHGENDKEVPLEVSFRTMRALRSGDVQLNVLKGGSHRLSEPHEIDAILRTVDALMELEA